jgi:hypothetical protein
MQSILSSETHFVADALSSINKACNAYVGNQVPANAAMVEAYARDFVNAYLVSRDEDIKAIVNNLNEALSKKRETDANAEGDLVDEIRAAVDVVEAKNLVLTLKD